MPRPENGDVRIKRRKKKQIEIGKNTQGEKVHLTLEVIFFLTQEVEGGYSKKTCKIRQIV